MTAQDKRNLVGGSILTAIVFIPILIFVFNLVGSSAIFGILFSGIEKSLIFSIVSIVVSLVIMMLLYDGGVDSANTTVYYLFQPPIEEVLFRGSSLLLVLGLGLGLVEITIFSIFQAFFFAVLHRGGFVKHLLLGIVWFWLSYFGGIVAGMLGHMAANLGFRVKARSHHGWYDTD